MRMKMRKPLITVLAIVAGVALLGAGLANMHYMLPPRLVVKFDGQPAANEVLILPLSSSAPYQLDDDGSITSPTPGSESAILIPRPTGGAVSVRFPKHGTKTVDIRDQMTTTTVVQYFGLVKNQIEQFDLTKEQVGQIESGQRSLENIQDQIRRSN